MIGFWATTTTNPSNKENPRRHLHSRRRRHHLELQSNKERSPTNPLFLFHGFLKFLRFLRLCTPGV
ncbi:hypothetical protein LINPERPRIM_LOCUS35676 [Linum perenne]